MTFDQLVLLQAAAMAPDFFWRVTVEGDADTPDLAIEALTSDMKQKARVVIPGRTVALLPEKQIIEVVVEKLTDLIAALAPSATPPPVAPQVHELVDGTLYNEAEGVIGRCLCGWSTGHRISMMAASAAFADHRDAPGSKPKVPALVLPTWRQG